MKHRTPQDQQQPTSESNLAKNLEHMSTEARRYTVLALPAHLAQARMLRQLDELLGSPEFLRAKLDIADPLLLINDFEPLSERSPLRRLQQALRLSEHALRGGGTHLAGQLLGRLGHSRSDRIASVVERAAATQPGPWIRPLSRSLEPPAEGLDKFLRGHQGEVNDIALTPDDRFAVSGGDDGILKVWDLASRAERRTLLGHKANIWCVVIAPDGSIAYSGSSDNTIRIWDLETGRTLRVLRGHKKDVRVLALSRDGATLVSGSTDGTVRIWDLASYMSRSLQAVKGYGVVRAVCLTPEDKRIVVGVERQIQIWDLPTGRELAPLGEHGDFICAIMPDREGTHVFSSSFDGMLKIWELASRSCLETLRVHEDWVEDFDLFPDGKHVITASRDHTLRIWDFGSGKALRVLRSHAGPVHSVALSSDARVAVSASWDGTVGVWDLQSKGRIRTSSAHEMGIRNLAVSPDGRLAFSGSDDGTLKIWDLATLRCVRTLEQHRGPIAVSWDGSRVLSGAVREDVVTLRLWQSSTGRVLKEWRYWKPEDRQSYLWGINSIALTPDGRRAITAADEYFLRLWDLESGTLIGKLEGHTGTVNCVVITPDGRAAITASNDGTIRIWDVAGNRPHSSLVEAGEAVNHIVLSPDGRILASADEAGTVRTWEVASRRPLWNVNIGETIRETVAGKQARLINDIAIAHELGVLLTVAEDAALRIWDLKSGRELANFFGDTAMLSCCAASSPNLLLAGERRGALHFLKVEH